VRPCRTRRSRTRWSRALPRWLSDHEGRQRCRQLGVDDPGRSESTVAEYVNADGASGVAATPNGTRSCNASRRSTRVRHHVTDVRRLRTYTRHPGGFPQNIGRAPTSSHRALAGDCSPQNNVISFSFANQHALSDPQLGCHLCWTVSQESAHAFGLDHSTRSAYGRSACSDPMTYRVDCAGSGSSATSVRPAARMPASVPVAATQNSHRSCAPCSATARRSRGPDGGHDLPSRAVRTPRRSAAPAPQARITRSSRIMALVGPRSRVASAPTPADPSTRCRSRRASPTARGRPAPRLRRPRRVHDEHRHGDQGRARASAEDLREGAEVQEGKCLGAAAASSATSVPTRSSARAGCAADLGPQI